MNQPQKPVRPPKPPPVPKDHIVDANNMVPTPRTDADLWSFPGPMKVDGGINVYVRASTARAIERELAAANAEVARLKGKVEYMQNWIRRLDVIEANPTEHRRWCGDIGWLNPGQCVFVGSDKPEGLQ